jgi:hypothetical protein
MIREIARLIDGAVLKVSCVVKVDPLVFPPEPIVESLIEPMTLVDAMSLGERLPICVNWHPAAGNERIKGRGYQTRNAPLLALHKHNF